ncbi:ABC transporter permease [Salinactinospora qingdaonensis]|uniref:ABC transporter permease subunit n=1 Tax=Salinactinospora qingdaonensis TaxID=702744 RepID=A0ABP7G2Q5_9ACTN
MSATTLRRPALPSSGAKLVNVLKANRSARIMSWISLLVAWQLATLVIPSELIPPPAQVLEFMWNEVRAVTVAPETLYMSFGLSFERLGVGLAIAFAIGTPIGLAMGMYKPVEHFLHDFVVVGLAMPSLVWALVAGMWFGFGNLAPVITVTLAAVTFVVINIAEGVRNVPKELLDMSAAYGVSRWRTIRHVIFPSLMPFFFAALRYGFANAWKGLVLAEVWASTSGAGWVIKFWYDAHRSQGIVGYALFFILVAILIERLVFGRLSNYVFRWRATTSREIPEPASEAPAKEGA